MLPKCDNCRPVGVVLLKLLFSCLIDVYGD
jgi:hypothetical protein